MDINIDLMKNILSDVIPHVTNTNEYIMRCPFCGDSKKDANKRRFYIQNIFPHFYYCHNCNIYGKLDSRLLDLLISKYHIVINKAGIVEKLNKLNIDNAFIFNGSSNVYRNNLHLTRRKQGGAAYYIEDRLGITLEDSDIFTMNIIDDLDKFLDTNSFLEEKLSKLRKVNYYNDFIGFLTYDNNKIICRNLDNKSSFRYSVTELEENSKDVYLVKKPNLTYNDTLKISISEGIFDCISAFKNLGYDMSIATLNTNHITSLEFLVKLCLDYKLITIDIILDNDEAGRRFILNKKLKYFKDVFEIHFLVNTLYKDIGVTKDKILLMNI